MKPRVTPQDSEVEKLFRSKLRSIVNLRHELVRLGELIDWARLEAHFAPHYREAGRSGCQSGWWLKQPSMAPVKISSKITEGTFASEGLPHYSRLRV